ncbi:MAG: hypothetical protein JO021_02515, partial [Alphaproteobacteria bacterium]|nr:hypothetical protein [Alphaproteobacteria bacterium]
MADMIDVADELYRAHDWASALEAYRLLAEQDPETAPPPFLQDLRVRDAAIAGHRARAAGLRVLVA